MIKDQIDCLVAENNQLRRDLDIALTMLAEWCVAVTVNGSEWDYWDEHYKDALYRPGPLREQLDAEIAKARAREKAKYEALEKAGNDEWPNRANQG